MQGEGNGRAHRAGQIQGSGLTEHQSPSFNGLQEFTKHQTLQTKETTDTLNTLSSVLANRVDKLSQKGERKTTSFQEQYFFFAQTLTSIEFYTLILLFYFMSLHTAIIFFYVHFLYHFGYLLHYNILYTLFHSSCSLLRKNIAII